MARRQQLPAVSKAAFERRNKILRREGFLNWERYWLAQHGITSRGMIAMRRDRLQFFRRFRPTFRSWNEYRWRISEMYRAMGWTFINGRLNPFKMLDEYKKRSDIPDTPQPKRRIIKKPGTYRSKAARAREKEFKIPGHDEYIEEHRLQ